MTGSQSTDNRHDLDPEASAGAEHLCGVRLTRRGALVLVRCNGWHLRPGQLVVAAIDGAESLATIIVGCEQLVENEAGAQPVGLVLRLAREEDVRVFGRRAARPLRAAIDAQLQDSEWGGGLSTDDAWLSPDGARLFVAYRGEAPDPAILARALMRLAGLPVELIRVGPGGALSTVSGVEGAGLPPEWDAWLVAPGASPSLLDDRDHDRAPVPSARDLIERVFPLADRETRGRGRGRSRRSPARRHEEAERHGEDGDDAEHQGRELSG